MEHIKVLMSPISRGGGYGGSMEDAAGMIEAPTGTVCFVATDIENGWDLWDEVPMAMLDAVGMNPSPPTFAPHGFCVCAFSYCNK
jgi:hypothetical protein